MSTGTIVYVFQQPNGRSYFPRIDGGLDISKTHNFTPGCEVPISERTGLGDIGTALALRITALKGYKVASINWEEVSVAAKGASDLNPILADEFEGELVAGLGWDEAEIVDEDFKPLRRVKARNIGRVGVESMTKVSRAYHLLGPEELGRETVEIRKPNRAPRSFITQDVVQNFMLAAMDIPGISSIQLQPQRLRVQRRLAYSWEEIESAIYQLFITTFSWPELQLFDQGSDKLIGVIHFAPAEQPSELAPTGAE